MSRRSPIRLAMPWPVFKVVTAVRLAWRGVRYWRSDWFRCAWHLLFL
jgi:hypothetical protein